MVYITIIVMLALVQFMYFGFAVGRARGRHGVTAPAVTGDEVFERFHRAHQNTLEQLMVFVPAVYACGYYANDLLATACGVGFLVGRAWYFRCYIVEPDTRGKGMIVTMVSSVILIIAAIVGAMRTILAG
ncbi:MAG: MAPEG family protein [Pseudomonadales bacterium]|nr:MAPEG family protein [Pseudomonadales bacterium]